MPHSHTKTVDRRAWSATALVMCCAGIVSAQTVGLLEHATGSLDSGYVLFTPLRSTTTYLIDKCGHAIHTWPSTHLPGGATRLLNDGSIVRAGALAIGGGAKSSMCLSERISWDGTVVWSYTLDTVNGQHHDFDVMPNGHLLIIAYDMHPRAEAIQEGRDSTTVTDPFISDRILELEPVGTDSAMVVWEWRAWDHIVRDNPSSGQAGNVADHRELIDINFQGGFPADWLHLNSVQYDAVRDEVLISCHNFSEAWIVDHSTTIAQAAGHAGGRRGRGGDLIYRWGNPRCYKAGTTADEQLFGQHDVRWIRNGLPHAGSIMAFNNGLGRPDGMYSSITVFTPLINANGDYDTTVMPYRPGAPAWSYTSTPPTEFFSSIIGSTQMLSSGNVLINNGTQGEFFEVDSGGQRVWRYISPVCDTGTLAQGQQPRNIPVYNCAFYPYSFAAFAGRVLPQGPPLEQQPLNLPCTLDVQGSAVHEAALPEDALTIFPNPAETRVTIAGAAGTDRITLWNAMGSEVAYARGETISTALLPAGTYFARIARGRNVITRIVSIVH